LEPQRELRAREVVIEGPAGNGGAFLISLAVNESGAGEDERVSLAVNERVSLAVNEGGSGENEEHANGLTYAEPIAEQKNSDRYSDYRFETKPDDNGRRHIVGLHGTGEERSTEQERENHNCGGDEPSETLRRLHECSADTKSTRPAKNRQHCVSRREVHNTLGGR
jgi:hypothetical protein